MLENCPNFLFYIGPSNKNSIYALHQDFNDLGYHQRKSILFFDEDTNYSIKITNKHSLEVT